MRDAFGVSLGGLAIVAGAVAAYQGSPMAPAFLAIGTAVLFLTCSRSARP